MRFNATTNILCPRSTILIAAIILAINVHWTPLARANELQLGQAAPAAEPVMLDGRHITTRDLRGHTVILTFWASWCEPCQQELPLLSRYASAHQGDGLVVSGFSLDDEDGVASVRRIAKHLSFPVGLLAQSTAPGYGRMWRIPVSFVIDRTGKLHYNGWQSDQPVWSEARLNRIVGPLLGNPPSVN